MNLDITRRKLQGWIKLLSARHIAKGKTWYSDAHCFAEEVAKQYSLPVEKVIGVLAVLSVSNRWDLNKRNCEAFCRAHHEGLDLADIPCATYDSQKAKAIEILTGNALTADLIGTKYAPKTRAFYDNILNPGTSYRVTIDRWILRGLDLDQFGSRGGNRYVALYRGLEELFRQAALKVGLRPCELQAAIWCLIQETASIEKWDGSRPGTGLETAEEDLPF